MTTTTVGEDLCLAVLALGDGAGTATAARFAGMSLEAAERAADALARDGVLAPTRPLRLAVPGTRALLLEAMGPGARANAHRRAVRTLQAQGARPGVVARHACAVEPAGDPAVAAALTDAAEAALSAGGVHQAALLAARALAEPPPREERWAAARALADALMRLGDPGGVAAARLALSLAEPSGRAAAESLVVDALWITGAGDAAVTGPGSPGIVAAQHAGSGCRPASAIAADARAGLHGATACERGLAITALIACDELEDAGRAVEAARRAAARRGALAELAVLARLAERLDAVRAGGVGACRLLPGPDPGAEPWRAWDPDVARRFGTASAVGAARLRQTTDVEAAGDAVAVLRESPRPALLCEALLSLGRAERHAGQRRRARDTLTEALALAERCGAAALAEAVRAERAIAGARPRREALEGPESLTASERRVADAVREGASNREVAAVLYLSVKTVEMHLGRVYRKLGIASRQELAGALAA